MKSSSRYFPVRLMAAEQCDGITEDVYLLKPNNSPDKSVELAVTHLSLMDEQVNRSPAVRTIYSSTSMDRKPVMVLLHGAYQNRSIFWRDEYASLARCLVESGVDVWLMEARGHGLSPENQRQQHTVLADYARYDIPAVNMFVAEQTQTPHIHWLALGTGAGAVLLSHQDDKSCSLSLMGMGEPFGSAGWSRLPLFSTIAAERNHYRPELGPEREPASLLKNLIVEGRRLHRRGAEMNMNLWDTLSSSHLPLMWLGKAEERGLRGLLQQGRCQQANFDQLILDDFLSGYEVSADSLQQLAQEILSWVQVYEPQMAGVAL